MKTITTLLKHLLLAVLFITGTLLFLLVAGEQAPDSNLTHGQFFLIKAGALAGLVLLAKAGGLCMKAGLLPDYFIREMNNPENEEV